MMTAITETKSRAFEMFRRAISVVLESPLPTRRNQAENFLKFLAFGRVRLSECENVAAYLPVSAGPLGGDARVPSAVEMRSQLTQEEESELRQYLLQKAESLKREFPDIAEKFKEQFS
jgi:hypothetical protein